MSRLRLKEKRRQLGSFIRFGPPKPDVDTIDERELGTADDYSSPQLQQEYDQTDELFDQQRAHPKRKAIFYQRVSDEDRTLSGGVPTEWPEAMRIGDWFKEDVFGLDAEAIRAAYEDAETE